MNLAADPRPDWTTWPLLICVLGNFRVLQAGQPVALRGGQVEALLCHLALHHADGVPRANLLDLLWPTSNTALAGEALYSRIRSVHSRLSAAIGGRAPVVHVDGCYQLNVRAGVGVDAACFDALAMAGECKAQAGHEADAVRLFEHAIQFYYGDLCVQTDLYAIVERERMRARYLGVLSYLSTHAYTAGDHVTCLTYAQRLLDHDPCREDAHRLVMRCYVRRGERAQALRQYQVCADILRLAFSATPEPETMALFERVRRDPGSV